jgi:hypothetical protein
MLEKEKLKLPKVQERLMEAAHAQEGDPGWSAQVVADGIRLTYLWMRPGSDSSSGNFYKVEALVSWADITHALENPLIAAMDDLLKQKEEWKP